MSKFEHVTLGWSAVVFVFSVLILVLAMTDSHRKWPLALFLVVLVIWLVLMVVNLRRMLRTQRERKQVGESIASRRTSADSGNGLHRRQSTYVPIGAAGPCGSE